MFKRKKTSSQWITGHMLSIYKKGNKKDCANYRELSFISVGRTLGDKIEQQFKKKKGQSDFIPRKSCVDYSVLHRKGYGKNISLWLPTKFCICRFKKSIKDMKI